MPLPSTKRLEQFFPGRGKEIRALLEGKVKTYSYESVQAMVAQCYHKPKYTERVMCALNEIIEGHGVEAIFEQDDPRWPDMEYVNTGDTYSPTIVFDYLKNRFEVTTYGDWLERAERNGRTYA